MTLIEKVPVKNDRKENKVKNDHKKTRLKARFYQFIRCYAKSGIKFLTF